MLYPHFQKAVVPGWLDKGLKWRHGATPFLDNMVVLAPDPDWVKTLPQRQAARPHRLHPLRARPAGQGAAWGTAVAASRQLADEFAAWLEKPDVAQLRTL